VAWPQLAVAAAIVLVLGGLVAIPIALSGRGNSGSPSEALAPTAPAATSTASLPPLVDRGASYSTAALDTLAGRITAGARDAAQRGGSVAPQPAQSFPLAALPSGPTIADPSAARTALNCLIAGGPPDGAQPVYLEEADVSGTPAYVGAFFVPNVKLNIMVIAVSRDGCVPLYSVRLSSS
jgi:hypothetical protein